MSVFNVDSKVFVKSPAKSWLPGTISARNEKNLYTVIDEEKEELHKVSADDLTPCREDLLNEGIDPVVHDLLFLTVLHDATLLRCLKVRYMKNIVYTNIGAIVVALNPFNFQIPWYLDSEMEKYMQEGDVIQKNLPHSWAVAHNTYYDMLNNKQNQTILVSGESGAGKTEACKMVLKYLGNVSMKRASAEQKAHAETIRTKINMASPILEGFGNAKTVRNNNSSRFGKFIHVKFHPLGHVSGAFTTNYLLEKSRIITAAKQERVYHAFYHLTKGKDAATYGVKKPQDYKSTFSGKCVAREDADDADDYLECCEALRLIGFTEEEIKGIWRVVAGCLLGQSIDLAAIDADTTQIQASGKDFLAQAAVAWGISAETLEKEILTTTNVVKGETFVMKLRLTQATDMRDALCKHVYEKLFQALVNKINESTDTTDGGDYSQSTISVLDIFGFEDFEVNSFEQLCINLANESLQNHYNNYIFRKDMEECRAEGIDVEDIRAPDNTDCLKLIVDNQKGIFAFLDEECRLGTGTDDGFLQKVIQNCSSNPAFSFKPLQIGTFLVRHYAGTVSYTVKNFLEKNRDSLKDDMKLLMRSSTNEVAKNLLPAPENAADAAPGAKRGPKTVGGLFKLQVHEMMTLINSTNPHWIRCVKPHPAKKPLMFDGVQVMNQLNSSGVLGTVKIRKAGYPVRLTFPQFLSRYKILIGSFPSINPNPLEMAPLVTKAARVANLSPKVVQCGKTRVFMKSEAFYELEKEKDEAGTKFRLLLQAAARCVTSQLHAREKRWTIASLVIQEEYRAYMKRSAAARLQRKIMREKMLEEQRGQRAKLEAEAMAVMQYVADTEEDHERNMLQKRMRAEHYWLLERMEKNEQECAELIAAEAAKRTEFFNVFRLFLENQRVKKAMLNLVAHPEVESYSRNKVATEELREFNILTKLFNAAGAAMFRVEVERNERRLRRLMLRLEEVQRTELRQRFLLFRECHDVAAKVVKEHAKLLRAAKLHSVEVVKRAAQRQACRESKHQIELFTRRNLTVVPEERVIRELSRLQIGSVTTKDQGYTRIGDRIVVDKGFQGRRAWIGACNVPDTDQIRSGAQYDRQKRSSRQDPVSGTTPSKGDAMMKGGNQSPGGGGGGAGKSSGSPYDELHRLRRLEREAAGFGPNGSGGGGGEYETRVLTIPDSYSGLASSPTSAPVQQSRVVFNSTNVFETFRDPIDEMAFLRMRHIVVRELRELAAIGRYSGPFASEAEITCKKKLFVAQEDLQESSAKFSAELVLILRRLNAFCHAKKIPEQEVTGLWLPFRPVAEELIQEFPPCTDWRRLLAEQKRLHRLVEHYRSELLTVIRRCLDRGAKCDSAAQLIERVDRGAALDPGPASAASPKHPTSTAAAEPAGGALRMSLSRQLDLSQSSPQARGTPPSLATPQEELIASPSASYPRDELLLAGTGVGGPLSSSVAASHQHFTSVDSVHRAYATLLGYFDACSRCLFPMAPKSTLISLRLLWPKVQDASFTDRCRDCMTSGAASMVAEETVMDSVLRKEVSPAAGYAEPRRKKRYY